MRPLGETSLALIGAIQREGPGTGAEIAARANVGKSMALAQLRNLVRANKLVQKEEVKEADRNRPKVVYDLPDPPPDADRAPFVDLNEFTAMDLQRIISGWPAR
jgi:predicted transcriptional regulator